MSDLEDCARDLYQLTLLSDEIQVRDQIDRCIHEYLAKAKWHSSVGAEKADLATVFRGNFVGHTYQRSDDVCPAFIKGFK